MKENFKDFQKDVIQASHQVPIVVDFWADWCAPCRMLSPILDKLAQQAKGKWRLVKINTEELPQVASNWQIKSIPAVKMFSDGKVVAEFLGALPEQMIVRWLRDNLPTPSKKALKLAEQLIQKNDRQQAKLVLQRAIEQDSLNLDTKILLAQIIFQQEPETAFHLVSGVDESHPKYDYVEAIRILYRLISSVDQFRKQVSLHQNGAWQLYIKGIDALISHDYDLAVASWIEVLQVDRKLDDDGARKACVSLFKLLGHDHEIVATYHRKFTSVLF